MRNRIDGFDWDAGNWPKCAEHGLTKADIESALETAKLVVDDPHQAEKRFRAVGFAVNGRYVFVAFTVRSREAASLIRPISARFMHRKEIESYEEALAHSEN